MRAWGCKAQAKRRGPGSWLCICGGREDGRCL
jgi:hypothetical protein